MANNKLNDYHDSYEKNLLAIAVRQPDFSLHTEEIQLLIKAKFPTLHKLLKERNKAYAKVIDEAYRIKQKRGWR